jgi:adenylate cyclase
VSRSMGGGQVGAGPAFAPAAPGPLRLVKPDQPPAQVAREELERLLASADFDGTPRSRAFLRFVVEETLTGRQDGLSQASLATVVFGRRPDFDPTIDPIVRIQAGRLRRSLERYYLLDGRRDPVRIELPRGSYVPRLRWVNGREGARDAAREPTAAITGGVGRTGGWPSLRIGPFRAEGQHEAGLRFCERLACEISRYGDLEVALDSDVGAAGAARFALTGHLDDGPTVVARLVDLGHARQAWADEIPGSGEEAARLIAARVASAHGAVARALWAERRGVPAPSNTPYDAVACAYQFARNREAADFARALATLRPAVAEEPERGLTWRLLAGVLTDGQVHDLPTEDRAGEGVACARQAVRLDDRSQPAGAALARALLVHGDVVGARQEAERALALDRGAFASLDSIGWVLTLLDDPRGPALVREAQARGGHPSWLGAQAQWADHLRRGEAEGARAAAQELQDRASFWPPLMRASALGHLGALREARAETAELLARKRTFPRRWRSLVGRAVRSPALLERVRHGLQRAGLDLV